MALTDEQRQRVRAEFTRALSALPPGAKEVIGISKHEVRAATDAIDNWIDANAASFNQALPEPAQSGMTTKHKARLFALITHMRFAPEDFEDGE